MKNLLLFVFLSISLSIYGQVKLEGISQKIKKEYVIFDQKKFDEEINNLSEFSRSLSSLNSWYKNKERNKGNIGASISAKLYGDKDSEKSMIQYALTIINYNQKLTCSVLGEENYQEKLNKLIEKTQKGKVTPELGQIIAKTEEKADTKLQCLSKLSRSIVTRKSKIKNRQTTEEFKEAIRSYDVELRNYIKEFISVETVEEDNPHYLEAMKQKKIADELASLPHQNYTGSYGTDGYAKYTYKEPEDGERIYDGKWFYKESGFLGTVFTSEGQYKKDIRVGKWIWTYTYKSDKIVRIFTLNFDENGFLHGEVSLSETGRNTQKVFFNHGKVVGKYTDFWDPQHGGYINIEFDQSSIVVGTATFKAKYYPGLNMTPALYTVTYENGKVVSRFAKNYQTGDKINWGIDIRQSFIDAVYKTILNGDSNWPSIRYHSPDRKSPQIGIYKSKN